MAFCASDGSVTRLPVPPDPTLDEQKECMLRHYQMVLDRFGEEKGTLLMRKYACSVRSIQTGARHFRTYIDKVTTPEEFMPS